MLPFASICSMEDGFIRSLHPNLPGSCTGGRRYHRICHDVRGAAGAGVAAASGTNGSTSFVPAHSIIIAPADFTDLVTCYSHATHACPLFWRPIIIGSFSSPCRCFLTHLHPCDFLLYLCRRRSCRIGSLSIDGVSPGVAVAPVPRPDIGWCVAAPVLCSVGNLCRCGSCS